MGRKLVRNGRIQKAIEKREDKKREPLIASRKDRQKFWTKQMKSKKVKDRDRQHASELLGRSEGDFLDRSEQKVEKTVTVEIIDSFKKDKK